MNEALKDQEMLLSDLTRFRSDLIGVKQKAKKKGIEAGKQDDIQAAFTALSETILKLQAVVSASRAWFLPSNAHSLYSSCSRATSNAFIHLDPILEELGEDFVRPSNVSESAI